MVEREREHARRVFVAGQAGEVVEHAVVAAGPIQDAISGSADVLPNDRCFDSVL